MNQDFCTFGNFEEDPNFESFTANTALPSYTSVESNSQLSSSPCHDTDSLSDKSKKIRKKRNTYQKIDDETRMKLLDAVSQGDTLKAAAKKFNVNYSSAKSILHTFRKEGRIFKKSAQERTPRKRTKTSSQDLEMSPIYLTNHHPEDYVGVPETYNPQPYFSDYKAPSQSSPQNNDHQRSSMTINTFGNHLKIVGGSKQTSAENYNSNNYQTYSPESQQQQHWQPAPQRHAEKEQHYYNMPEQPAQNISHYPPNIPDNCRTFDPIYVDLSKSQQIPLNLNKRDDYYRYRNAPEGYYPRGNYPEMQQQQQGHPNQVPHHDLGPEQNSHDVSCFLNSNPSNKGYNFQQQRGPEVHQYQHNYEQYPPHAQYRNNVVEHQSQQPEGGVRGQYPNNYNMKFNENTPGMIKTASLKSY